MFIISNYYSRSGISTPFVNPDGNIAYGEYKRHPHEKRTDDSGVGRKKVIILSGPTATGKTKLSLTLAKAIDGEIISADSMQVYKGMDIGTAKASPSEREAVRHHLIDIREIAESFNVADFCKEAWEACHEVFLKNKVPILVGGTGFYIHAFIYGPPKGPPSVPEIRKKLEEDMARFGPEMLYEKLKEIDPLYASTITQGDRHKIIRALEIIKISHQKVSDFRFEAEASHPQCDFRCWFIYYPKNLLYPRIEARCDQMLSEGFIDEVKRLVDEGLLKNPSASGAIGYRQCIEYLNSAQTEEDYDHFVMEFKKTSRRYAKRQFTWFRKEVLFRWLNQSQYSFHQTAEIILQDYESYSG